MRRIIVKLHDGTTLNLPGEYFSADGDAYSVVNADGYIIGIFRKDFTDAIYTTVKGE